MAPGDLLECPGKWGAPSHKTAIWQVKRAQAYAPVPQSQEPQFRQDQHFSDPAATDAR